MNDHIPDPTKMINDTPRTDEAQFGTGRVSVSFARQLERELTAANWNVERLTKANLQLREGCEELKQLIKRLEEAGNALLWYFCPKNTGDISFLQSEAIKQWNKAKEAKP
jgi:hypothetical protein